MERSVIRGPGYESIGPVPIDSGSNGQFNMKSFETDPIDYSIQATSIHIRTVKLSIYLVREIVNIHAFSSSYNQVKDCKLQT